jgi:hypothetical protein
VATSVTGSRLQWGNAPKHRWLEDSMTEIGT